ncbi:MAG TPA: T9SS type A sorting domain-containing protein [Chitinophagaceae bacterium]|nr:T9SS type A sorting domain-containing protein [Chitinophagaceae bacterium]
MTYSLIYVVFTGASPATLTTNGSVIGTLNMIIEKPGSGLTLGDNLIYNTPSNSRNTIILNAGYFNAPGRTIKAHSFGSNTTSTRSIDISNASLELTTWSCTDANKTVNAASSFIKTLNIWADQGNYYIAEVGTATDNLMNISNTTFQKITFTHTSINSQARILNNNNIDSIIFLGSGSIRFGSNVVDYVSVAGTGSVGGSGNQIHYMDVKGAFTIMDAGNNVFDSLLTAPNKNIQIAGTNTINQYFRAGGAPCDGFTEITGVSSGTLNFSSGATYSIDNVLLTNLRATGTVTNIIVNGIDNGGNTGFTINEPTSVSGTTLYWVGGAGDWNDKSHWSYSSGGPNGACIPFINDNVVFDANSGFAPGNNTVTTSANTYCHNITWASGVGTTTFNESGSFSMRIYGSVVLQSNVTTNAFLQFVGTEAATIAFNGGGAGSLRLIIQKTGAGSLAFDDNWSNTGASIAHVSGGLSMAGRTVSIYYYDGNSLLARSLDISNATITVAAYWDYRSSGKTLSAEGSHLSSGGGFGTDALSYPWVDITGTAGIGIGWPISGTTFGQLTFTNTSPSSGVFLAANNTVRRLEFKSNGSVGANCIIDSLILTGSRVYGIGNNVTINKYLKAESAACSALMEIRGPGSIAFATGAVIQISNVYMGNMTATGSMTPIAFTGANAGGNTGWTITSASGGPRYWVGGSGDWSDPSRWSATSGGPGGSACVPTVNDDVYFDANSFTAPGQTVTVNNSNAYCRNMTWTGATFSPVFNKSASFNLEVWGNLVMNPAVTMHGRMNLMGAANSTITSNGANLGDFDIIILKPSGSTVTMTDNYSNSLTEIELRSGALNISGRTITVQWLTDVDVATGSSLDATNTIFNGGWHYRGAIRTLQAAGSVLNTNLFRSNGHIYNVVNVSTDIDNGISVANTTIDSLVFTNPSSTSQAFIGGTNNINYLEFKGKGLINGTGNVIGDLVFYPGKQYSFLSGSNTTITGNWFGSGTPCNLTEISSTSTSSNATVTKTSGTVEFDYVRLRRISGTGGAAFSAREHTIDQGNNTNWTIAPYNGAAPIYGLGPDIAVFAKNFPLVLRTDGFFGSPSSQYTWNDNSHADTLLVPGPGTYSVTVTLPDGCSIYDEIVISPASTLPVRLTNFAVSNECQPSVNWKIADAVNFSHFIVEQSKDGRQYSGLAKIAYTPGIDQYSYTDKAIRNGSTFYRLKCVDADGGITYSAVASVNLDCNDKLIGVHPTITTNTVKVTLPQGYENARLYLMNSLGQRIVPVVTGTGAVRTLNLHELPAATYMLLVTNGRETKSFKIVKQ